MRFDFVHDAPWRWLELARSLRLPERLKTPLCALATATVVVSAWAVLEHSWIDRASDAATRARVRFEQSRLAVARARLERVDVERMIALDRTMREIRASGGRIADRIADVGNHLVARAWLTSFDTSREATSLEGAALDFEALRDAAHTFAAEPGIAGSLHLARAAEDARGDTVEFELGTGSSAR
ncbi:MAG: hypothetical protein KGN02_09520 [bacterium]|nr:hypothetical protein [bacterium]